MKKISVMGKALLGLLIAAIISCATVCLLLHQDSVLEEKQQSAIELLDTMKGEYCEESIVLYDTNRFDAQALATKLGAKLRITKNGQFATLTLPEGVTIKDVFEDDSNKIYLDKMSVDYSARISDAEEETDDTSVRPNYTVADDGYESQTYLDYLNLSNVWSVTKGKGVTIAVIDSGIDTDHPEFAGKISEFSYNASSDKIVKDYVLEDGSYDWSLIEDYEGHGTAVAGVISANMDGEGVVGIAPEAELIVIKVETVNGIILRGSDVVFAMYYAIERDVDVANVSIGGGEDAYGEVLELANDSDVIFVAAAGNDGSATPTYPAADKNAIGVGALDDECWGLAEYSNYGDNSDIVAPGTVYTTAVGGGYRKIQGTSFAAPNATAVIALYLSRQSHNTLDELRELLYASARDLGDLGEDSLYGFGAIDASALILEDRGTVTFEMLTDEVDDIKKTFIRLHTLQDIPVPERNYAVFEGWYYDPHFTQPVVLFEDRFVTDLTLYAKWGNEDDDIPFTYARLEDGTIEIRSYTGNRRYITVPEYIEGSPVTSIGAGAFAGLDFLRTVELPATLKTIKSSAFKGCTNLGGIVIPDGVTHIGDEAFYNNVRLTSIEFADNSSLQEIGDFAFANCSRLREITLPSSLESINGTVFSGAKLLRSINVAEGNEYFSSVDGVLFNITQSTLIAYPNGRKADTYFIPDTVRTVGEYAFYAAPISRINLNIVSRLGYKSFATSEITDVHMPDTIVSVGSYAFANCSNLTKATLSENLTSISNGMFSASNLREIVIPSGVRTIGESAFEYTILTKVTFSEGSSLVSIGNSAFALTEISEIEIPASVSTINSAAFYGCRDLYKVDFAENSNLRTIGSSAFASNRSLGNVTLPDRLERIGSCAFEDSGLTTIFISKVVTEIGTGAFSNCQRLTAINVDPENKNYSSEDGVLHNRDKTVLLIYPVDKSNATYTLVDTVKIIESMAFYGAKKLISVTMPEGLHTIESCAFYECRYMVSYELPSSLVTIGEYAFAYNNSLRSIHIPENVVNIARYAFMGDYAMSEVTFSENTRLSRIGFGAFGYCGIQSIRIPASVTTVAHDAFEECNRLKSVIFAENSKLEYVPAYFFLGCENIESITFEQGSMLTHIQAHAFDGLSKLSEVNFGGAQVTVIDNFSFRYCDSLETLILPETLTDIGRYAFYGCSNLSELTLPESMEFIGENPFLGTDNIKLYFVAESLPRTLKEYWDYDVSAYFVGVTSVETVGDWTYGVLKSGNRVIIEYAGTETNLDLSVLDFGGDIVAIAGGAFADRRIDSIILPSTLTEIQARTFFGAEMGSIVIPASVEFIAKEAFMNSTVSEVIFESGSKLRVIEQSAFENTKHLACISLPDTIETLGSKVFSDSGITSLSFGENPIIKTIPANAFSYTNLTEVTIPDSVTLVDDNAFRNNTYLTKLNIGKGDKLMFMSNAFYQTGLTELNIPENLYYIGEYCFVGLENLKSFNVDSKNDYYKSEDGLLLSKNGRKLISVPAGREGTLYVPKSVESIGFGAFENSKLSEIVFDENANILTFGYRSFFDADYITEIVVPKSIISIDYYAFANCDRLESVIFHKDSKLKGIYEGAFYGDKMLQNIVLPSSIVEISDYAFYDCELLDEEFLSNLDNLKGIYDYAMAYTGIKNLELPESVIDLGDYAFKGTPVETVHIPAANGQTLMLGIGVFEECNNLKEMTIPFVGAAMDEDKLGWFGYIFGAGAPEANYAYIPESLESVTITEGMTFIDDKAFLGITSIKTLDLPKSLVEIGTNAFKGSSISYELKGPVMARKANLDTFGSGLYGTLALLDGSDEIHLRGLDKLEEVIICDGVYEINDYAFEYCTSIKKISLPSTLISIGDGAFRYCTSIEELIIPDSVTHLGDGAFTGCSSLINLKLGSGLTSIGSASTGMTNLSSVTVGKNMSRIPEDYFYNCKSLTTVTILSSVKSIGENAFYGCSNIESVYVENIEAWQQIEFANRYSNPMAYGSNLYVNGELYTEHSIPDGVTTVNQYAFNGCDSLQYVYVGADFADLNRNTFWGCSNLSDLDISENNPYYTCEDGVVYNPEMDTVLLLLYGWKGDDGFLDLPDSVVHIGDNAFREHNNLRYISILDTRRLQSIGDYAFAYSSFVGSSEKIYYYYTFLNNIETIGDYAFYDCDNFKSMIINSNMESIGDYAFAKCDNMYGIQFNGGCKSIGKYAFSHCENLA